MTPHPTPHPTPQSTQPPTPLSITTRLVPDGLERRYARQIVSLHHGLRYHGLVRRLAADSAAYVRDHGHGMVTVAARTDQIPERYLLGLSGFRLAQYLELGYASAAVATKRAMFCEPLDGLHPADHHCVTLDSATGEILGYVALGHSSDPAPRPVSAVSGRRRFPCEEAHDLDLFSAVTVPADLMTHEVREVKRFVHARTIDTRTKALRVSLELIGALARTLEQQYPGIRALVGDVEPRLALRHLVLMGLHVQLVQGTTPFLPEEHVMSPMYVTRKVVQPFLALLPPLAVIADRAERIEQELRQDSVVRSIAQRLSATEGTVERIAVAA